MARHSPYQRTLLFTCLFFLVYSLLDAEARTLAEGGGGVALAAVEKNRLVVGEVDSHASKNREGVDCKKRSGLQCEEHGNGEVEDSVFETGDYIYTNSNP